VLSRVVVVALLLVGLSISVPEDEWQEMSEASNMPHANKQHLPLPYAKWMVNNNMSPEQEHKLTNLLLKVIYDGYDKKAAVKEWLQIQSPPKPQQNVQWPWDSTPTAAPTDLPANYHGMPDPLNAPIINPNLPGWIFYTGLTGSSLYATLDKPGGVLGLGCGPSARCSCHSEEFNLYLDPVQMLLQAECWLENMSLRWDEAQKATVGVPGVKIRTKNGPNGYDPNGSGFGGAGGCFSSGDCFAWGQLQGTLINQYNYSMAQFRSVVWDWRLGPHEWTATPEDEASPYETGNFAKWKTMYEELKAQTGHPSYVVTISQGGTIFKTFLQNMDQSWKDQHIAGWFSYNGVFAGAVNMAYNQMSGLTYAGDTVKSIAGFSPFDGEQFRKMNEALPGMATVAPILTGDTEADNRVLFMTPSRNYTYAEYTVALRDSGLTTTADVMDSVADTRANFDDPGVRTWCLYSTNYPTQLAFEFSEDFNGVHSTERPKEHMTQDGDGTVHLSSLDACKRWNKPVAEVAAKQVTAHVYEGLGHTEVMGHKPADQLMYDEMNRVTGHDFSVLPAPGSPCDLCEKGECAPCAACASSKDGECAPCWSPDGVTLPTGLLVCDHCMTCW